MSNIIVINPFEVPKEKESEALESWDKFADYFRKQPGYVSSKLHKAVNPEARFHLINVSEWESPQYFEAAVSNPEVQKLAEGMSPEIKYFPGLYEVIRN